MNETKVSLAPGRNQLPQLYNASVAVGSEPPARILATTTPLLGTTALERRDPRATTVAFGMEWHDAIRLAVEILQMAKATKQDLPEGVEVPDRRLIGLDMDHGPLDGFSAFTPPDGRVLTTLHGAIYAPHGMLGVSATDALGQASQIYLMPEQVDTFVNWLKGQREKAVTAREAGFPSL